MPQGVTSETIERPGPFTSSVRSHRDQRLGASTDGARRGAPEVGRM